MNLFRKKEVFTDRQKQIKELTADLRYCQYQMKRCRQLFELTTDENLIEARIYEMKSLAKHHDYLVGAIRSLTKEEKQTADLTVNV